jgi:glycerol-3-phosphate O-acyltransferase / dihydroxyacetone phosphate acyltransferase
LNPLLLLIYYTFKLIARISLRLFYHRIDIIDHHLLRINGPAILIMNHPNTLMDALIAAAYLPGQTFFLANYSLFKNPVSAWLLNRLFCIPIQRYQDTNGQPLQNEANFDRAVNHLLRGGKLLIAPEGVSLYGRTIQPLRTGAARIALKTVNHSGLQQTCHFLSVGINYSNPQYFGSHVVLHVGQPLPVNPYTDVRELTNQLAALLQSITIHTPDPKADRLLHLAEILLQNTWPLDPIGHYRRTKVLLQHTMPERDIKAYFTRLKAHNIQDFTLLTTPWELFTRLPMLFIGLPFFFTGWLLNAFPFHLPGLIARLAKAVPEYQATWKYLIGLLLFPAYYAVLNQTHLLPVPGWVIWLGLPVAGILAWYYVQFARRTRQQLHAQVVFRKNPSLKAELLDFRKELLAQLPT